MDLLLGLRDSYLHGCTVQQWGNLRLLEVPPRVWMGAARHAPRLRPDQTKSLPASLSATAYAIQKAEREPHPCLQPLPHSGTPRVPGAGRAGRRPPAGLLEVPWVPGLHVPQTATFTRRASSGYQGGAGDEGGHDLRSHHSQISVETVCPQDGGQSPPSSSSPIDYGGAHVQSRDTWWIRARNAKVD